MKLRTEQEINAEIELEIEAIKVAESIGETDAVELGESIVRCLRWVRGEDIIGYGDNFPPCQPGVH
jgi:hypothetical protein